MGGGGGVPARASSSAMGCNGPRTANGTGGGAAGATRRRYVRGGNSLAAARCLPHRGGESAVERALGDETDKTVRGGSAAPVRQMARGTCLQSMDTSFYCDRVYRRLRDILRLEAFELSARRSSQRSI